MLDRGFGLVYLNVTFPIEICLLIATLHDFSRKSDLCWNWGPSFGEDSPRSIDAVLLTDVSQVAKGVDGSEDMLADIFSRIENFFKRVGSYKQLPPTPAMTDMIVKIIVEVLSAPFRAVSSIDSRTIPLTVLVLVYSTGSGDFHTVFSCQYKSAQA